jgi:hypothetical protein
MQNKPSIMAETLSLMKLHLRYRLWIAEMNEDITVLRIFDDYLTELTAKKNNAATRTFISDSRDQFADYRKEIDELKHDLHLHKMKLAAQVREEAVNEDDVTPDKEHIVLQNKYAAFREKFDKAKKVFVDF